MEYIKKIKINSDYYGKVIYYGWIPLLLTLGIRSAIKNNMHN
jgi:hypothetical protein